ncbi:MAG TPA: serine/threonine-protein kinase [Myxococcota bacterium]|nr:serine/threonine-protein kinase [Myxococcota bacterium]HRY96716.1 serine/threonine-protein kinase [Myxococcota bacterium]HSA21066.1 serine/threonine-protein kinase [Myxococcota bacterium]
MSQGTPFGRYVLLETLSSGPLAELHRAVTRAADGSEVQVVVKRIRDELASDPAFAGPFLDEARLATVLQHPNIARVYEWGREGESLYIAMEYIQGTNLGSALQATIEQGVRFQPTVGLHVLAEVLQGLTYAHELTDPFGLKLGVVHRNICPQNIVLSAAGQVKLVDFGLALATSRTATTRPGMFAGGLTYLAPEVLARAPTDFRADLFSVGTVLYEVLTGRKLHVQAGPAATQAVARAVRENPPSRVHTDIPPALDELVVRATSPAAGERPASAREFRARLVEVLASWSKPVEPAGLARYLVEVLSGRARQVSGRASFAFGEATSHWFAQGEKLERLEPGAPPAEGAPEDPLLAAVAAPAPVVGTLLETAPRPDPTDPVMRAPRGRFADGSTVMAVEEGGLGRKRTWKAVAIVLGVLALGGALIAALLSSLSSGPELGQPDASTVAAPTETAFSGPVALKVQPSLVAVFVDGDPVQPEGEPPALLGLRAGTHRVRLVAPGHLPWEGDVVLVKDAPAEIAQSLEVRQGTLAVKSTPPKAIVWLDGKKVGLTPLELPRVDASRDHALQLVLRGYAPHKSTLKPADWPDDPAAPLTLEKTLEKPRKPAKPRRRGGR